MEEKTTAQARGRPGLQLEKLLRQRWVLWAGVLGASALLLLSFWEPASDKNTTAEATAGQLALDAQGYEQMLEERLRQLLGQVEGAGEVTVMVTLENTAQTVYAQAYAETGDETQAADGASSQRTSYSTDYVLVEAAGSRQALAETTVQPTVKGVAVVCSGANDARVVSRITQLVSTVLGIPTNRICVTG